MKFTDKLKFISLVLKENKYPEEIKDEVKKEIYESRKIKDKYFENLKIDCHTFDWGDTKDIYHRFICEYIQATGQIFESNLCWEIIKSFGDVSWIEFIIYIVNGLPKEKKWLNEVFKQILLAFNCKENDFWALDPQSFSII